MTQFIRLLLNTLSGVGSIVVYVTLIIEFIFMLSMVPFSAFNNVHYYIFLLIFLDSIFRLIIRPTRMFGYARLILGLVSILPILNYHGIGLMPFDINLGIQQGLLFLIAATRVQHLSFLFEPLRTNPTQSFVGGFVLFILLGAVFLTLPSAHVGPMPFIDALFTAASAVCVTGLNVVDVGTHFSSIGHLILLILIQVGGLGIMTFYGLVTLSLHQRFLSQESQEFQQGWSTENSRETFGLIRSIFVVTFVVELIGAMIIFSGLPASMSLKSRLFSAVFHSVSAFCNAGFSLFSDGLALFSDSNLMLATFAILIFLGGIGFPVLFELYHRFILKDRRRLKLQTKMALIISLLLILAGTLIIYFQSLVLDVGSFKLAFFHSVSSRTAGFSMLDLSSFSLASLWFILLLMFIGASPGSTGGGIKTTTFGLLIVALLNTVRSNERIHVFDRHVKPQLIFKALTILTMSFTIVFSAFFVLLISEDLPFFSLLFETISAFATVGYSVGITNELSDVGKLVFIFLMFFGRVGPLTLAFALTRRPKPANYQLPDEQILLG